MSARVGGLFDELRRRRVFRVGAAYLGAGLAVVYAGDVLLPRLGFDGAQTILVVLVILGFPLTLALAWAFDVTPEGVERTRPSTAGSTTADASGQKSIVVLPFDNMSPDPEDRYLGDGLTEELTAKLSRLKTLRVISRTSAMTLKGGNRAVPAVARELGVQYVLEGSVRKAGEALRVTAQLIDAPKDQHLWSESYTGTVEDVFGMQEKVSLAIVDALRLQLSPEETRRLEERPFQSFQAYQYYVQARADALLASEATLDRALETLKLGLETVGENELLLVARGFALFQFVNTLLKSPSLHGGFLEEAQRCADRALALNPYSAPARALKGFVLHARGDIVSATTEYVEALSLDPNNPEALLILGYFRASGGWDPVGAHAILNKLERIDPLTPLNAGALGWLHWFDGDFRGALNRMQPWWNAMDEGNPWLIVRAYLEAAAGDRDGAERTVEGMRRQAPEHLLTQLGTFLVHAWRGERTQALATVTADLETAASWDDIWPLYLAAGHAVVGAKDDAFRWLDHAVAHGVTNVAYLRDHDPFLADLRGDRRFDATLGRAAALASKVAAAAAAPG